MTESASPLLPPVLEFSPLVTPCCLGVCPPGRAPSPVPEALGGALTATFLILMTTMEGEGIVGGGGMKGFPEPNFKANWENGWGWRLFCNPSLCNFQVGETGKWWKGTFLQKTKHWEHCENIAWLSLNYVTQAFNLISPSEFALWHDSTDRVAILFKDDEPFLTINDDL